MDKLTSGSSNCLIATMRMFISSSQDCHEGSRIPQYDYWALIIYISDTVIFTGIISFLISQHLPISKHLVSIRLVSSYPSFSSLTYLQINSDLSTGVEVRKSKCNFFKKVVLLLSMVQKKTTTTHVKRSIIGKTSVLSKYIK